ncbi:MAG: AAA family ATPase [Paludibacteraceae bacterium]|nr:AAA family ATPase [Paludibacteraceae bacterium]
MMKRFLSDKIIASFEHEPTSQQQALIDLLSAFVVDGLDHIFLLKGYAGTGKTSVVSALIRVMDELEQPVVLMAPTGRAAKVLSSYSGHPASTVHRKIYRQRVGGSLEADFSLNVNLHKHTLFIVDEASMLANAGDSVFGTGNLLDDLMSYVYGGDGCRMIMVGDTAQLPPVGQEESPALCAEYMKGYGFPVDEFLLTDVVRQANESGILYNATALRLLLMQGAEGAFPTVDMDFPDVKRVSGEDLIEEISSAYNREGMDETIIVSRSNKRTNIFNEGIRNRILYREEDFSSGDWVMVVKNNYFWSRQTDGKLDFIANGDISEVRRVRRRTEVYGFHFAEATLYFPDYEVEIEAKILLDTLRSESPSLTYEESNRLFLSVQEDYMNIGNKRDRLKAMREDPFLNALQLKFAYAVTCHKAQGGQWSNVFLDKGYVTDDMVNAEYLRWLYTAFTRATKKLYLINW